MGEDKPAVNHISSVDRCNVGGSGGAGGGVSGGNVGGGKVAGGKSVGAVTEMRKDQNWIIKGRYNYDERPGNIEDGKQGAVMAISIVLVAVKPGGVPSPGQGWIGWVGSMVGIGGGSSSSGASGTSGGGGTPAGELSPSAPAPVWNNGPQAPPGPNWVTPSSVPNPVSAAGETGDFAPGMGF